MSEPPTKKQATGDTTPSAGGTVKFARRQIQYNRPLQRVEVQGDFNIWYGKQLYKKEWDKGPAGTRCNVALDSGETKAKGQQFICIYFAQGRCEAGPDCHFYHRIPNANDEKMIDMTKDIFGRDRYKTDRDDMGGVGSFSRENKTLYVNGLVRPPGGWESLYEIALKQWSEWGPVESIKIFYNTSSKPFMFVTYKWRVSAEFAKEAMQGQNMGHGEILNVRWATEDPNPKAKAKAQEEKLKRVVEAAKRKEAEAASQQELAQRAAEAYAKYMQNPNDWNAYMEYCNFYYSTYGQMEGVAGAPPAPGPAPSASASTVGPSPAPASSELSEEDAKYEFDPLVDHYTHYYGLTKVAAIKAARKVREQQAAEARRKEEEAARIAQAEDWLAKLDSITAADGAVNSAPAAETAEQPQQQEEQHQPAEAEAQPSSAPADSAGAALAGSKRTADGSIKHLPGGVKRLPPGLGLETVYGTTAATAPSATALADKLKALAPNSFSAS